MSGFGTFDRYDFIMYLLFAAVWVGALVVRSA